MYHEYPYTTYFHDIDKMCGMCRKLGYRLEVSGDYLKLIDGKGNVISNVKIAYADKALTDVDGKAIKSYLFEASTGETTIAFQKGDGSVTTLTIPYATKAKEDVYGVDLASYLKTVQVSGDKIHFTNGDGTSYELTMPYAIKASTDENGKDIDTYAATLTVDGNNIVLLDSLDRELARITAPYAIKALGDADGDTITSTYAATLETGTTTVTLKAKSGATLSTITVPYATKALTDTDGNRFLSDYAEKIVVDGDGRRIGVEAHDGTRIATITVPYSTLSENANNAIQNVAISGDQIIFTKYNGQTVAITAPFAVKAQKDDNGNTIKSTYVASVDNDPNTGALRFYDALGQLIATITPTVTRATEDSLGNTIFDYIKTVVADPASDYVVFTHGDGDVDTITVPYSIRAWKDSLGQPIQNTYLTNITIEEDKKEAGKFYLTGWNGDIPRAKIVEIPLEDLLSGLGDLAFKDYVEGNYTPQGSVTVAHEGKTIRVVSSQGALPSCTYDASTEALYFNPGTLMTYADTSVMDNVDLTGTFTGTPAVIRSE